jgi:electron transfer flavoprotein beta subunit
VVRAESPDLVLCGVQSSDAVQAATGAALAELLDLPRVAVVTKLELGDGSAIVHRELEGGLVDVVEVDTPAVLTIQTGINEPRYATLRAIKQAEQKEIEVREPGELGPPAARVRRMYVPPKGEGAEMLDGDAASIAARIKELIGEKMQ